MRHTNDKPHKSRKFLKMPSYPGGKNSFREFVAENLRYPEAALQNNIQGTVYLEYTVDNIGTIDNIVVTKGIGHGCDEEAIRLVKLISYPSVRNRGIKMKVTMKTRIAFTLPKKQKEEQPANAEMKINYSKPPEVKPQNDAVLTKPTYGYTITINPGS
jgi:protein TonB